MERPLGYSAAVRFHSTTTRSRSAGLSAVSSESLRSASAATPSSSFPISSTIRLIAARSKRSGSY